ncbi:MAG TPA: hypothetical protein PLW73_08585 [Methanoregulaceae archaeon]|jgi:hypothetical protein|nr:hypothetical protein [Methanoregulaceae archaeon]
MPITYDSTTGKWMTDQGTEVDPGRIDKAKEDYEKDKDWSRDEHEKIVEKAQDTAIKSFQPPPPPIRSNATGVWIEEYKRVLEGIQTADAKDASIHITRGNIWNGITKAAETGEEISDIAIDSLANVTGPVGRSIKKVYKVTKSMGKNISESYAKEESLWKGTGKGLLDVGFELGFDKLKDKGLKALDKKINPTGSKKISNLINPQSADIGELTPTQIADLVEKHGHGGWAITERTTSRLSKAAFAGTYKTTQGLAIKYIIKDPIKTKIGLKKAK